MVMSEYCVGGTLVAQCEKHQTTMQKVAGLNPSPDSEPIPHTRHVLEQDTL